MNTTDKERMMHNELRVIEDMKELLQHREDEGLQWHGTKTDLVEMVHILYESEEVRDEYGVPVAFKALLCRICMILQVKMPRNPCSYLGQARECKGIRRAPLLIRYKGEFIVHSA